MSLLLWRWWLTLQGFVASLLGMKRRELELQTRIWKLAPSDGRAGATVATLLVERGRHDEAVAVLEQTLGRTPDYADGWFNLGFIHEQRGDIEAAERCFRRALELNPKLDRAWYGLALALIRAGRLQEAIPALQENIRLQPFSPYGYYQLGMTHHHLGQADEALRVYERLKHFEPKYAATLRRDLDSIQPRARADAVPLPTTSTGKEALTAGT